MLTLVSVGSHTGSVQRSLLEADHQLFAESVGQFVARHVVPAHESIREQRLIPRELWLEAGRQGFLGFGIAEEHGGNGVTDFRFNVVLGEALARVSLAMASSFGIHTDVVAPYLIELTTDEQRKRWLPRFCTGEAITAIGMTEPGAGSDLKALRTKATRDGDDWIVDGSKTFITNGYNADLVVVAAKTDPDAGARGISLFVLERGMPGFERGRKLDKTGQHESDTAELFFDNVRVPADNMIGELNRGFQAMMFNLAQERISCAMTNLAQTWAVVEATLEYVKERKAFGQPVGSFQHNKFVLADAVTQLDVAQAFIDRCLVEHVAGNLTAIDAAKAKYWSSEVQNRVIDACVQLHGGYGYMQEYLVARAWADARVTRIYAGSSEIMREIIGRDLGL
jgi:alkylation response protein AidB-like acyl-CoA dehydrogenase